MKPMILVGLMAVAVGSYSSVYACDHSRKNAECTTTVTRSHSKTTRTVVIDATSGCKSTDKTRVVTFEIDVPDHAASRSTPATDHERASAEPHSLRTVIALGRAIMTTIGAIAASLLGAVSQVTASLV